MDEKDTKLFTCEFMLTASECNPEQEMPVTLMVNRLIEIATMAANAWGVGYADLIGNNCGWVLTRLAAEMTRYPQVNERYSIDTWIDQYNNHYSQRNMEIRGCDGAVIGYARTIWMVIDFGTRTAVDITRLSHITKNVLHKVNPIAPQGRVRLKTITSESDYTFKYCDCDVNRHVNTTRYVELLMNQLPLELYDNKQLKRLELTFMHEAHYGDTVSVKVEELAHEELYQMEIDGHSACHMKALLAFSQRPQRGEIHTNVGLN